MTQNLSQPHLGIIGSGAWGTALAIAFRRQNLNVSVWAHEASTVEEINHHHTNQTFLPGITLDPEIKAFSDFEFLKTITHIFLVCPAQHMERLCQNLKGIISLTIPLIICAKGIDEKKYCLMSQIVENIFPQNPLAVLSGPTFAIEVAENMPTALTLATHHPTLGEDLVALIGTPHFRPYLTDDIIGTQVGGAVKNVLAIASGMIEGRGYGKNTQAALLTRSLVEISRLCLALGGEKETVMGLSGLGDLLLTATSPKSRNFSLGVFLGQGHTLHQWQETHQSVAEGIPTAAAVHHLATQLGIDMPICTGVHNMLHEGRPLEDILKALLSRPFRSESDEKAPAKKA